MNESKEKISMFQVMAIYILSLTVPGIRTFFTVVVKKGGNGAWISPFIAIIPSILFVFILNKLLNIKSKNGDKINLTTIFDTVFGKVIGFILSMIYLVWVIFSASLETRLFAERLISTTFIYTPIKFFILTMLVIVAMAARNKITYFGRFAEIILELFVGIVFFVFISGLQNVEITNLWPPTDFKGIFVGSFSSINLLSLLTFSLFISDKIIDKEKFKKFGIIGAIVAIVISILGIIITLGTFGKELLPTFSQPFFMAVKVISIFGVLERIESIFTTFWVAMDFIIITYSIIVASQICKFKFKLSKRKLAVNPIILTVYILSAMLTSNFFSLQLIAREVALNINIIFGFVIPVITYIVAKIRKLV